MLTLGIETSCDETAAAIVESGKVLASEVSSSVHLHSRYGGVVPEIASRFHAEYIYSVTDKALKDAGCKIDDIDLVAVTNGPGLPGSLLVGISFAKALSFASGTPIVGVNHLHAHIISGFLGRKEIQDLESVFPFLGVVVSGGHTSIYLCRSLSDIAVIGRTKDDAVGEAFDKVAKMIGLGYPGGPIVEERAKRFRGKDEIGFPRALLKDGSDIDFSFSGVKTAVMYYWNSCDKSEDETDKICYSFQEAVIDVLDRKIQRAVKITGVRRIAIGGGVINNLTLRNRIENSCGAEGIEVFLPSKEYCSDNAAMIASMGEKLFSDGMASDLHLNAAPSIF